MTKFKLTAEISILFFIFLNSCSKKEDAPLAQLTTTEVTNIEYTSAKSGGIIINDGGSSVTVRGVCWSINASPTISDNKTTDGSGGGTFSSSITGLTPNATYFVRAYAVNANGAAYGISFSFTTKASTKPELTTSIVINAIGDKATSGGNITSEGGATVTARGVCWSSSPNPMITNNKTTDGNGPGSFTSNLTGLTSGTTYYVRAYAINSVNTAYGNEISFVTSTSVPAPGPTDSDGNVYTAVTIGTQVWTVENLKTTKYANGVAIPNVALGIQWVSLTTGAWSYYNNDAQYDSPYGKMYNWFAVADPRKLCPNGWHVPTQSEWATLANYLGGETVAGGKMKEAGLNHWQSPNTAASNNSGFTGLPGGVRGSGASFFNLGITGIWWSSTEDAVVNNAKNVALQNNSSIATVSSSSSEKQGGMSVRCIKD